MRSEMFVVSYKRTILGWFNVTVPGLSLYNVDPVTFYKIAGVNEGAYCGTCEFTGSELDDLKRNSIFIAEKNKIAL